MSRRTVVLATDGGRAARAAEQWLVRLVDPRRTRVVVLGVVSPAVAEAAARMTNARSVVEAGLQAMHHVVDAAVDRVRRAGLAASPVVLRGDATAGIREVAAARHATLVVVGARPWQDVGLDRLLRRVAGRDTPPDEPDTADEDAPRANRYTSVSRRVLRNADVPTLVVRTPPPAAGALRVAVGHDGSAAARAALATVTAVGDPRVLQLELVSVRDDRQGVGTVTSADGVRRVVLGARVAPARHPAVRDEGGASAAAWLDDDARAVRAAGFAVSTEVLDGAPDIVLADRALEEDVDLVAVGSRGLGPVRRALQGSVGDTLLQAAPAVLVAPDPGIDGNWPSRALERQRLVDAARA